MIRPLCFSLLLAFAPLPLFAVTYTLEPDYTQGVFRWSHLGFSSPAAQFAQSQGTLEFDAADPTKSSVKVTISLGTLNTGVAALDEHLRSADFFDVTKYPTATFRSTSVQKTTAPNKLKVTGDLNLHGVTKAVTLDVTLVKIGTNPRSAVPTIGFDATTTLVRSEFGLGKFVPQVSDKIEMRITCQAAEAKAHAEFLKAQAAEEAAAKDKSKR